MKVTLSNSFLTIVFSVLFFSCQRELNFDVEPSIASSLQKDIDGNCLPVTIAGTYIKGQNLGDTNYLEVTVNVTTPAPYTIITDTVNGYSFKASGNFAGNGINHIRLIGTGNPVISGTDHFIVRYNESVCQVAVPVGAKPIIPAVFTLAGAPDNCINDTIYGSYVKGVAMDTSDQVKISLNVTTPGSYNISTNAVNGFMFSASGAFPANGVQTVNLTASGTPINNGANLFTVTAGTSACNFTINILTAVDVSNNDYFPLTDNSYWTYDDLMHPGDSLRRTVVDTITIDSNLYKVVREDVRFGGPYEYFFRKTGANYFESASADKYTTSFSYNTLINVDFPFLKENLTTGDSWVSEEFTGTTTFGQVLTIKYEYECIDANATVTLSGKAFTNVYKIKLVSELKSINNPYGFSNDEYLFYYAKGIGLIYLKKISKVYSSESFLQAEFQLRNWKVN